MMATIDRGGRVVIPKEMRDRLDLHPGSELSLLLDGFGIRIVPVRPRGRNYVLADGFPVIESISGVSITDADVVGWRDADQR